MMVRKGLETTDRDFKVQLSPLRSLKMHSHNSFGKSGHASAAIVIGTLLDLDDDDDEAIVVKLFLEI
ncbi:hypothetical protein TSUD_260850 [Trifolium subterraneum]|uniref:Uncharacterized protein n=1 Tax=Trifolium subterraneum TaxID=3900 RepID=A0A2Z6MGU5_TRISU|nr:hypothetical protein TSUD_260850 [Trifolium subterraneum]